nr:large subunit ribosomal protein L22 [uncultured archaeon]
MYKYATKTEKEKNAKAVGLALPISTKHCVEICNYIRGKRVEDAIHILEQVLDKKHAIPYKKYKRDLAHRKGIGPGRYPEKTCKEIIKVLKSASANAQYKGMGVSNLYIKHICAHLASRPWHYGRQSRRKMKRSHVEVVLEEREIEKQKPKKMEKEQKNVEPKKVYEKSIKKTSEEESKK